jgi:zinc transporter, ZIP family
MEFSDNFWFAFLLTVFAGLSTGIGSAIAFFAKKTNKAFLATSLGFSGGVMIYVSFVEIFQKSRSALMNQFDELNASLITTLAFFGGILVILLIDKFIPEVGNPHEPKHVEDMANVPSEDNRKLYRMGMFTALAIAIHNFPEGLATFTAAMTDPTLGISIAVAIAIHNIPEGIAVSVPVYYSTGSKLKAFWLSFFSGLAEPVGALVGYLLIMPYMNDVTFGILFASVAGIMVFISLDELLPTAREYDTGHMTIYGLIAGMAVMAGSLLLFM